ncbi:hypothetical protein L1987_13775 [Smallanthus sonchifolius]|uniref:Uncharacterized protein n=1 Tax=Smallanthus sonchifolius TaxID=185202 RepID=A0ACB9JHV0_9ASTR|nr:hypothetical protein L1987_13775 [Smallanthus sonchifolius]
MTWSCGGSSWQQTVPYWEKRFVSSVGSLSWKKFSETKEFTHLYHNILKWDDSAAETAFRTAKDRFFAKFHGLPYDDEPHDPDLYIDKIDWNAQVDYNLMQDLESEPTGLDDGGPHEPVVIFGDVLPDPYNDYSPYGWGDSDDKIKKSWEVGDDMKRDQNEINWDDYIDNGRIIWNENDNKTGDQGWNITNAYDENDYYGSYDNVNNKRRVSSHKTWVVNGNNDQRSRSWRNKGNGRKSTGQGYGNRRGRGSTIQRVHVHP